MLVHLEDGAGESGKAPRPGTTAIIPTGGGFVVAARDILADPTRAPLSSVNTARRQRGQTNRE